MSVLTATPPSVVKPSAFERSKMEAYLFAANPAARTAHHLTKKRADGTTELRWIWIVLIVAVVIIAGIGAMVYVATYCIGRGGSYAGGLGIKTNGWKVWEYRLTFKCTR